MIVKANAKVNLSLDITGKRADGYHTLCSVMQSVTLCDTLELVPSDGISVSCDREELSGDDNLAVKAAKLFFEKAKLSDGVHIKIKKQIPIAGGLGGGSADAAAVLVALNRMYDIPFSMDELSSMALSLGADVPFCLVGGTQLAKGIGEELTVLPSLPECNIVIAKKGIKSSTKDMYRAIDSTKPKKMSNTDGIIRALNSGDINDMCQYLYNRFEEVAEQSILLEAKNIMLTNRSLYSGLSGAGPSVIGVFKSDSEAKAAVDDLKASGFEVFLCEPAKSGIEIIE